MGKLFVVLMTVWSEDRDTDVSHVLGVAEGKSGVEEILREENLKGTVTERFGDIEVELTDAPENQHVRIYVSDHELKR